MRWLALSMTAFIILLFGYKANQHTPANAIVQEAITTGSQPATSHPIADQDSKTSRPEDLRTPASLRDIQATFNLQQDEQSNLIITLEVLDLFEFYLSAYGELTNQEIHDWIAHHATAQLTQPALQQIMHLFHRYTEYLQAAADLPVYTWEAFISNEPDWQSVRQQLADIEVLRRYHLPAEYEVFFAADAQDSQRLLNQLQYAEAPAAVPAVAIHNESAARMINKRQQQRAEWQQRLEAFSVWQQNLSKAGLAPREYEQLLQHELQQRFTETEQYRVKSVLALW